MTNAPKTIHIQPGSELDHVLKEAGEVDIELEANGVRYRVSRIAVEHLESRVMLADERDIWAGYAPERVRAALRQSAGGLRGVDRDQLLADLSEQREQDRRAHPA
ncbi:MAG TPA: hypothetical protein VFI42_17755 [Thermomicrobiaceae bacterium]|nr:hypothetical protein [Thermomicrobiaceae bacterium]